MVFDTEMYARKLASRNTGGQASKASNIGEVCQFAAAGKEMGKKSLSEIAMSYGYVCVGQIALGANPAQALKVIQEAEAYNGPSLIIGYAPCELHGVKGGMNHCQDEMKAAVKAGYLGSDRLWRAKPVRQVLSDSPSSYAAKGTSSASTQPSRQKARIRSPLLQKKATALTRHSSTTRHDTLLLHVSSQSARKCCSTGTSRRLRTDLYTCRSWLSCINNKALA